MKQTSVLNNYIANNLRKEDQSVHDWYRFVLSFPPHLVRDYLEKFGIDSSKRILDPFCGTGTTLVECKKLGIPNIGIEANNFAYFVSQVKTNWDVDSNDLLEHAIEVVLITEKKFEAQGIIDYEILPPCSENQMQFEGLKTLPPETTKLLIKNSISPLPLHKTLVLLDTIREHKNDHFFSYECLALAKALVVKISNLHFGPEVGVRNTKSDAPVVSSWLNCIQEMTKDLRLLATKNKTESILYNADSRIIQSILKPMSVDAVITSPPYPNEKDYTRTTRLESVILGFIKNRQELRNLKLQLLRSNTRGVYKGDRDDELVSNFPKIQNIAEAIENRRIELGKTSGFERLYAKVTKLYFGGMFRHLLELRKVLRPGAHLAYVVGDQASYLRVMIRTGQLLADIAQSLGYEVVGIDLFRTRLATATKDQLREEIVVLRWTGESEN